MLDEGARENKYNIKSLPVYTPWVAADLLSDLLYLSASNKKLRKKQIKH